MIISSYDGSELELTLSGYRWPDLEGGRQTLYWLKVHIRVIAPFGSCTFQSSCLLDWEAEEFIQWLEMIARGNVMKAMKEFYDGTLRFEVHATHPNEVALRCCLISSLKQWTLAGGVDRQDLMREHRLSQCIDLMLSCNQLARAAYELKQEFEKLPIKTTK